MTFLLQFLMLVFSFAVAYAFSLPTLSSYTTQIIGFLIFIFLVTSVKKWDVWPHGGSYESIFLLTTIIFLLVLSTGGIFSPLFFLLYFLAFGIAFIADPRVVLILILGMVVIFLPQALNSGSFENAIKIASLVIISPLAYFFGKTFKKEEELEEKIDEQTQKIEKSADDLLKTQGSRLDEKGVEKVDEILEETEELRKS